ncbi:MAG: class I SAM-dependent methyltransferase [Planctomycetes bacterium]|nr:class I SAM-dependent methyltransferase [Planctomycetota bacterium]
MSPKNGEELPDWFSPVAQDALRYCRPREGVWVDLGSGSGGLGLALSELSNSLIVLVDPNAEAVGEGLDEARDRGLWPRVVGVIARAESIPLPDSSVDMVVSRGSIFFWDDPPAGLSEVYRVLRPGCRAMIGGGFGSSYPEWALKQFFRRRYEALEAEGEEAVCRWNHPRRPEWLAAQAREAGIGDFDIVGKSGLSAEDPAAGIGRWLLFKKVTA